MHCPINEQTADGIVVGRCWYHLIEKIGPMGEISYVCSRHKDVTSEVRLYVETGKLTYEKQRITS